jgi:hypothetical protein
MKYDSEKTHSELIAEREYWKKKAERHAGYAKAVILAFHRFEDESREALDSLGQS